MPSRTIIRDRLLGCVDTKTVNVVRLNERLDPLDVAGNDCGILGVHIREWDLVITEPAVLFTGMVAPLNLTVGMVLRLNIFSGRRGNKDQEGN